MSHVSMRSRCILALLLPGCITLPSDVNATGTAVLSADKMMAELVVAQDPMLRALGREKGGVIGRRGHPSGIM